MAEDRKVGEVATEMKLSIRAQCHYDNPGIITPPGRTPGG